MQVRLEKPDPGLTNFSEALFNPELPVPEGLVGPDGKPDAKRFNVYRNNVAVSLSEALGQSYPAILNLLGEDYFVALARAYVSHSPPKSPVLMWYGADFSDFIAAFPPLEAYPYLADVARLEWLWLQAYHAEDRPAMDPGNLGQISAEQVGSAVFDQHPAAFLVSSQWPVFDLVRANRFEPGTANPEDLASGQSVLISRPDLDVEITLLGPGDDVFLQDLFSGRSLAEASESAQAHTQEFSLPDCLSVCLSKGAFAGVCVPN